ncbi:MAG TPA: RluA family pseudouridine synthase [Oligoflexia bacterium]|nr:RluA family pseudouridine synthase [Oligoflexia bacterium]HMP27817.1 RluA family pseudouridine synthase [Oligoflexia bacterium]
MKFKVDNERERLDLFLARQFNARSNRKVSRSWIKKNIEAGNVLINQKIVRKAGEFVESGDQILCNFSSELDESSRIDSAMGSLVQIVYEDQELLIVNKPAGLAAHPVGGAKTISLIGILSPKLAVGTFADKDRLGLVHRLDRDTTGLMVVAKNGEALKFLSEQFKPRFVEKKIIKEGVIEKQLAERVAHRRYLALCLTTPRAKRVFDLCERGTIDLAIGHKKGDYLKMVPKGAGSGNGGGRRAVSDWQVIKRASYANLVGFSLRTGRTHQIRVHCAAQKAPVLGDSKYGDFSLLPAGLRRAAADFGRQALHAEYLSFVHPRTHKRVEFYVDLPDDFKELIKIFERWDLS